MATRLPIATLVKMMEGLPEPAQEQVVEHLREYIADLQDEIEWDALFAKTRPQLAAAARRAKQEILQRGSGLAVTTHANGSSDSTLPPHR